MLIGNFWHRIKEVTLSTEHFKPGLTLVTWAALTHSMQTPGILGRGRLSLCVGASIPLNLSAYS